MLFFYSMIDHKVADKWNINVKNISQGSASQITMTSAKLIVSSKNWQLFVWIVFWTDQLFPLTTAVEGKFRIQRLGVRSKNPNSCFHLITDQQSWLPRS